MTGMVRGSGLSVNGGALAVVARLAGAWAAGRARAGLAATRAAVWAVAAPRAAPVAGWRLGTALAGAG